MEYDPTADYGKSSDEDLLLVVHDKYYSPHLRGSEAVSSLVWDIHEGVWREHGVTDERMAMIAVLYAGKLADVWSSSLARPISPPVWL